MIKITKFTLYNLVDCEEIFINLSPQEQKNAVIPMIGTKCPISGLTCQQNFCCSCEIWRVVKIKEANLTLKNSYS